MLPRLTRRQILKTIAASAGSVSLAQLAMAQLDETASISLQPRRTQGFHVHNEGQIYYWTAGTGPWLVLVHQSANSSDEFLGLIPRLKQNYRLLAVDLPGHGRSDDPVEEPTVEDYAASVRAVLDLLNVRRAHLLGHHGGALTAMSLAADEPKRFSKLILSGTGGIRTPEQNKAFLDQLLSVDTQVRRDSDFVTDSWSRYVDMASDGAEAEDILRPFIAFLKARLRPFRAVAVYLKWDRRPAIGKLREPVLLVQGSKDNFVSDQETLLTHIPNSSRVVLPGCGTFMFYDRPDVCAQMIGEFLV